MNRTLSIAVAMMLATAPISAISKVSEEEAAQLGNELTPVGADPSANADGTIPAWSGSMQGLPDGLTYGGPGTNPPNPYASDEVLHRITAENVGEFKDFLSPGLQALFAAYPETFRVNVFPTHRDGAYSGLFLERARYNAVNAELYNGEDGIKGFTGGVAFPIPNTGACRCTTPRRR